jgi:hypothetical protein
MVFYQDTAPTGWTIENTLDDKLLFITKGSAAGGQTGGGAHSTGTWALSGIDGGSHILTTAEIPAHQHSMIVGFRWGGSNVSYPGIYDSGGTGATTGYTNTDGGSGEAHKHKMAAADTWRPAAYCAIIASKD